MDTRTRVTAAAADISTTELWDQLAAPDTTDGQAIASNVDRDAATPVSIEAQPTSPG